MSFLDTFRTKLGAGAIFLCLLAGAWTPAQAQVGGWGGNAEQPQMGDTDTAPLPEEKAFQVEAIKTDDGALVRLTPAPGYYLYQAKTHFADQSGHELKGAWPQAEIHDDPHFGPTPIHRTQVEVPLTEAGATALTVSFQGCQERGICYPPMQRTLSLGGSVDTAPMATAAVSAHSGQSATAAPLPQAQDQEWAAKLASRPWMWTLGAFFLVGLGLSMTPCVLPMVPIVLGVVAPSHQQGKGALRLAALYVIAHAAVLSLVGAAGAALGGGAGLVQQMQTPLWLGLGAGAFIALAAWQAGWVGHGAGARFTQWLHAAMGRIPQGRAWGALALGAGSALVLGPCVAPATAGALLYVANKGSITLGAGALFAMGLGMGFPMLLLAAGGQRLVPTAGAWMENLTKVGAMGLLGVAAILLDRATGQQWQIAWLCAWAGATASLWAKPVAAGYLKTSSAAAAAVLVFVAMSGVEPATPQRGIPFQTVSAHQLQQQLSGGRPIVLDLSADWCTSCLTMEETTFSSPDVASAVKNLLPLRLNLDQIDPQEQEFLKQHGLIGPPAILFFDANGREIRSARLVGPEDAAPFIRRVQQVALSTQS